MNQRDDSLPDLRTELLRAIGDEPVMASMPADDLARGRRLVRRRRLATVTVTAATLPAMALGGWSVAASLGGSPWSGIGIVAPADGSSSSDASPPQCAPVRADAGRLAAGPVGSPGRDANVSANKGKLVKAPRPLSGAGQPEPADRPGCQGGEADGGAGLTAHCDLAPVPPSDSDDTTEDCLNVVEGSVTTPEIDRVAQALREHTDPDGAHTGDSVLVTGSTSGEGDQTAAIYVSTEWADGGRVGAVAVSLEEAPAAPPDGGCQDQSMPGGPDVTCQPQTLPGGITVIVGRGEINGAQRITVRFDRPDGTVVIATADAASERWWTDRSGAGPLQAPPLSVEELVDLARDPAHHL